MARAGNTYFGRGAGVSGVGLLLSNLASFVVISSLAGVLLAGLALPVVGSLGLTAKAASDHFEDIPDDFTTPQLPQRTTLLADDGSVIASTWSDYGNRVVLPMSDISPYMPDALVAIEDQRFYQHGGIDLRGTVRAMFNDSAGGAIQGGSDIAQQYVKNVLLLEAGTNTVKQQEATEDTFTRKITELKYAIVVEQTLSKQQILTNYMNLIYYGNNAYGVEAAAEEYFSTSADKLTPPQAALLAAVINNPTGDNPLVYPAAALARRNEALQDMALPSLHYLTPQQAAAYEAQPLGLSVSTPQNGCLYGKGSAAFYCSYVYDTFLADPTYGATEADREALWNLGGLTIHTTMNVQDETSADSAIQSHVYASDYTSKQVASALAEIQPGTGEIKAIAQSVPMGSGANQTYLDFATDQAHNGGTGFQAGSSFKIFVGLAALEQGINPNQQVATPATLDDAGFQFKACINGATQVTWPPNGSGGYEPTNDAGDPATNDMTNAFAFSVNTYFLRLEEQTGLCQPSQIAQSMGVTQDNDSGSGAALMQIPSFTLGSNPITPVEMAGAYATIAAQGKYCKPIVIMSVNDSSDKQYGGQTQSCAQVIPANVANELTSMLQQVILTPGATAYGAVPLVSSRPLAGKTGTTTTNIATWFDGYDPQLAMAVWTGMTNYNASSTLQNITIGGTYYGQVYGASISAPIFNDAMSGAMQGQPVEQFTAPTGFNTPGTNPNPGGGNSTGGNANGNTTGNNNGGFLGGLFGGTGGNNH
jgi:membrane peptidoglycan carboxypeptidase